MDELKIGIVGLGWAAGGHINAFKNINGAKVTAICSRREQAKYELEKRYGIPLKAYIEFEDMLKDEDIDIIDICTPHSFHAKQSIAAAQSGKHVIVEKPICLNLKEAVAMREAFHKADVYICVCFQCRYSDHFRLIKSVIDSGLIGEVHYGEVDYYNGLGPWLDLYEWNRKKDGGKSSLLTAGCHALDGLLFFMEGNVQEVTSYATNSKNPEFAYYQYETTSVTILKFKDGRIAKVASCIDCYQPYYLHIHLIGSEGSILDNKIFSNKIDGMNKKKWSTLETSLIDSLDVIYQPYERQFQEFIDNINEDHKMKLDDFDSALITHKVIFAADKSASKGKPVNLA